MADDMANKLLDTIADTMVALEGIEKAFSKSNEPEDLPGAFHEVFKRVELIKGTLTLVEHYINERTQHEAPCQELMSDAERCERNAKSLLTLFRKVAPQSKTPRPERYRESARDLGGVRKNRVEALMLELLQGVQDLGSKCVIEEDGKTIKAVGEDQLEKLAKAVQELSSISPSLSEDASGGSVNNWSTGTQNVNTGGGTQNNNTGTGSQYIGSNQYFGKQG